MTIQKSDCWAERRALMDMTMLGSYGVSDRVGVTEWIENMSDENVSDLTEHVLICESESEIKNILETQYLSEMSIKSSAHIISESALMSGAMNVLMEADEASVTHPDLGKMLKHVGYAGVATYIVKTALTDPDEAHLMMINLKKISATEYDKVARIVNIQYRRATGKSGELFPRVGKYIEKIKDAAEKANTLHTLQKQTSGVHTRELKNAKTELQQSVKAASKALDPIKAKAKKSLEKVKPTVGLIAKNGTFILGMVGITGLLIHLYKWYQLIAKGSHDACKKLKKNDYRICVVNYKIKACDSIIKKLQDAIPGCANHKNPDRCSHSLQTHIWNWTRKKKAYQEKLVSLKAAHPDIPASAAKSSRTPVVKQGAGNASSIFRARS